MIAGTPSSLGKVPIPHQGLYCTSSSLVLNVDVSDQALKEIKVIPDHQKIHNLQKTVFGSRHYKVNCHGF